MSDISYHVLTEATTKLKNIHVDQIRIEIDIKDAQTDPLTLQQIRSEQSIRSCFIDRAKNVNGFITTADTEIGKTHDKGEQEHILNELNKKLALQVDAIEKEVQSRVNAYIQKQKVEANSIYWASVKMKVKVFYSIAKFGYGVAQTVVKAVTATTAPVLGAFITASAIKGAIDNVNEAGNLYRELMGSREGEQEVRKKLKAAVGELRKLKSPEKVPQSKIDAVMNLMTPYSVRLASIDTGAKQVAAKLDAVLTATEKKKFRIKKNQELLEGQVDTWIHEIIQASQAVTKGKGLLQNAKDALKDASQRAQKDPMSFWGVAGVLWKKLDLVLGSGEEVEKVTDMLEKVGSGFMALGQGLAQEYADAKVEEKVKV